MPKPRSRESQEDLPEHIKPFASQPGPARCMKCSRTFNSADRLRIRICPTCTRVNEDAFVRREVDSPPGLSPEIEDW